MNYYEVREFSEYRREAVSDGVRLARLARSDGPGWVRLGPPILVSGILGLLGLKRETSIVRQGAYCEEAFCDA